MGEAEYPLVRDDGAARFPHPVGMEELMATFPDLGWLLTPAGLIVFAALLGLVMSGYVGRIVHYVETVLTSIQLAEAPVRTEKNRSQAGDGREPRST